MQTYGVYGSVLGKLHGSIQGSVNGKVHESVQGSVQGSSHDIVFGKIQNLCTFLGVSYGNNLLYFKTYLEDCCFVFYQEQCY